MPDLSKGRYTLANPTLQDAQVSDVRLDSAGRLLINVVSAPDPNVTAAGLGKAEDAPHTTGDVGVMMLSVRNDSAVVLTNTDLDYSPISVDNTGAIFVAGNKGAFATGATSLGKAEDAAHVSGDTGVMLLAVSNDNNSPRVSNNGDYAPLSTDVGGVLITKDFSASGADWSYAAAAAGILNTNTAVTVKAAAGASVRNFITGIHIMAEALGAATEFAIRDGAAGTVLWRTKIGTGGLVNGLSIQFLSPLKGTANTLLEVVTLTASVTGAVYVNLQGYTGS